MKMPFDLWNFPRGWLKQSEELHEMPIHVVVCADKRHVVIRITDRARGIPRQIGSKIWSTLGFGKAGKRSMCAICRYLTLGALNL